MLNVRCPIVFAQSRTIAATHLLLGTQEKQLGYQQIWCCHWQGELIYFTLIALFIYFLKFYLFIFKFCCSFPLTYHHYHPLKGPYLRYLGVGPKAE
jgi:hypothetical protein